MTEIIHLWTIAFVLICMSQESINVIMSLLKWVARFVLCGKPNRFFSLQFSNGQWLNQIWVFNSQNMKTFTYTPFSNWTTKLRHTKLCPQIMQVYSCNKSLSASSNGVSVDCVRSFSLFHTMLAIFYCDIFLNTPRFRSSVAVPLLTNINMPPNYWMRELALQKVGM